MIRTAVVICLVAAGLVIAPPAHAGTHGVRVENNVFVPRLLEIEPGDTVVWSALHAGHTVTADDRRFDFHRDRALDVGERVTWRFGAEEDVRYYCKLHGGPGGQGMAGVIRVGDPPRPRASNAPTVIVPDDKPTIREAAAAARPKTQVLVRPGVYAGEVVAAVPGLIIRGLGSGPGDVVLDGGDARSVGITVRARGVRIENLTVRRYGTAGIAVGDALGTVVTNTFLHDNGLYGIDGRGAAGLAVQGVHAEGHGVAGISVRDCEACGVRIEGGRVDRNAAGIVAVSAIGVVVRGTNLRRNAVGIVLRDVAGGRVSGTTVSDNDAADVWIAAVSDGPEPPTGAGISVTGGRDNLIVSNTVTGHTYNVAVTGPPPSLDHAIVDNTVGGATHADFGWDGLGAGVCFGRNRSAPGGDPSTDPPWMSQLNDCGMAARAGVPYPLVTANLARHARYVGYPA